MNRKPRRPIYPGEARSLLREAVRLNIQSRKPGCPAQVAEERDRILADLNASNTHWQTSHPTNIDDYKHPMDV